MNSVGHTALLFHGSYMFIYILYLRLLIDSTHSHRTENFYIYRVEYVHPNCTRNSDFNVNVFFSISVFPGYPCCCGCWVTNQSRKSWSGDQSWITKVSWNVCIWDVVAAPEVSVVFGLGFLAFCSHRSRHNDWFSWTFPGMFFNVLPPAIEDATSRTRVSVSSVLWVRVTSQTCGLNKSPVADCALEHFSCSICANVTSINKDKFLLVPVVAVSMVSRSDNRTHCDVISNQYSVLYSPLRQDS